MLTPESQDKLAEQIAQDYIQHQCECVACETISKRLARFMLQRLRKDTEDQEAKDKHDEFFGALFKAIEPYERRMGAMLQGVWDEERRIIIANLKKTKKAWRTKDKIDNILYPVSIMEKKIADETNAIFVDVMTAESERTIDRYSLEMSFDVENPEVQKWLKAYTPELSKNLEAVNTDVLRRELIAGISDGEGIPQLIKRVNKAYSNIIGSKQRSEKIARTETLLASNKGNVETYKQSGIVKAKQWQTFFDRRTCPSCELLDGKIIGLEENYFSKGDDPEIIEQDGRTYTFKNDYRDIGEPPRHVSCRCSIVPVLD